jgi:hypothetical protein
MAPDEGVNGFVCFRCLGTDQFTSEQSVLWIQLLTQPTGIACSMWDPGKGPVRIGDEQALANTASGCCSKVDR